MNNFDKLIFSASILFFLIFHLMLIILIKVYYYFNHIINQYNVYFLYHFTFAVKGN